jgi:hypothetical protein
VTTRKTFSDRIEERTTVDAPPALREPLDDDPRAERTLEAGLEVVIVPRGRAAGLADGAPWHFVQLWTQKRIYAIDLSMVCVGVFDRVTGKEDRRHVLLGGRLTGGQHTESGTVKMVYPLPVPGTQGVFELTGPNGSHGHTSTLERVLLRLPAITVTPRGARQTWEAIRSWVELARGGKTER